MAVTAAFLQADLASKMLYLNWLQRGMHSLIFPARSFLLPGFACDRIAAETFIHMLLIGLTVVQTPFTVDDHLRDVNHITAAF